MRDLSFADGAPEQPANNHNPMWTQRMQGVPVHLEPEHIRKQTKTTNRQMPNLQGTHLVPRHQPHADDSDLHVHKQQAGIVEVAAEIEIRLLIWVEHASLETKNEMLNPAEVEEAAEQVGQILQVLKRGAGASHSHTQEVEEEELVGNRKARGRGQAHQ